MSEPRRTERDRTQRESALKQRLLLLLPRRWRCRIFNNPVGEAWIGKDVNHPTLGHIVIPHYRITYGLAVGSGDLIGISAVTVTPAMVGQTVGIFTSIECKAKRGRETAEQKAWRAMVREHGGIAGTVRDLEDLAMLMAGVPDAEVPGP